MVGSVHRLDLFLLSPLKPTCDRLQDRLELIAGPKPLFVDLHAPLLASTHTLTQCADDEHENNFSRGETEWSN